MCLENNTSNKVKLFNMPCHGLDDLSPADVSLCFQAQFSETRVCNPQICYTFSSLEAYSFSYFLLHKFLFIVNCVF